MEFNGYYRGKLSIENQSKAEKITIVIVSILGIAMSLSMGALYL